MTALTDHRAPVYYIFSVLIACEGPLMVSSGKKRPFAVQTTIYFMATTATVLPPAEIFLSVRTVFFCWRPFFLPFNLSWIDVPKNYGFDMWRCSFSLSLHPHNCACLHTGHEAHHSFAFTREDIKHYNCSQVSPPPPSNTTKIYCSDFDPR